MKYPTFNQIRRGVLFLGGLVGVAYVTLIDTTDRPTLLILFAAMMGLPLFLETDERIKHRSTSDSPEEEDSNDAT